MNSPIKRHGGKHYLAPKLIPYLPPHVHRVYPYSGGASELFAWPFDGVSEVVNDLDSDLMAFWKAIACPELFGPFKRFVESVPFSEQIWQNARTAGTCTVDRAVRFFIRCRQSRQGLCKDFATLSRNRTRRGMNEQVSSWLTAIEGLPEVHARLARVVILNRKALDVIQEQDGPDTFFYCDPPYLHETRSSTGEYQHEMAHADHIDLLVALGEIEGRFMLSGYPSDLYYAAELTYRWNHVDFDLPNNSSSSKKKERKIERVWMNYTV